MPRRLSYTVRPAGRGPAWHRDAGLRLSRSRTGSMILQVLLGGFAGLALAGKLYWRRFLVVIGVRHGDARRAAGRAAEAAGRPVKDAAAASAAADGRGAARARAGVVPRPQRQRPLSRRPRPAQPEPAGLRQLAAPATRRLLRAPRRGRPHRRHHRRRAAARRRRPRRARAHPLRLLSLRMALRDAEGRGAPASRADAGRAGRGLHPQGLLALQRPVARRAAGLHRHPVLRAARPGRALGRLPPVLRADALSADAAGLPRHRLPPVAARPHRRHPGRGDAPPDVVARPAPLRRAAARRGAEPAAAALFRQRRATCAARWPTPASTRR